MFNQAAENYLESPTKTEYNAKTLDEAPAAVSTEQSHHVVKADDHDEGAERQIPPGSVLWVHSGTEEEAKFAQQRALRMLQKTGDKDEDPQQRFLRILRKVGYRPEHETPDTVVDRPQCEYQTLRVV